MSGHCELCGETGGHSAACVSNPYQAANQRVIIATLTADLARLTAELERKQMECERLRSALDDLIGAVKHLNPCPATMEKATAALSAGDENGHA